jgi:hypothetical protein
MAESSGPVFPSVKATVPGGLSQLSRSGGFLGFGQAAPPGVPESKAHR